MEKQCFPSYVHPLNIKIDKKTVKEQKERNERAGVERRVQGLDDFKIFSIKLLTFQKYYIWDSDSTYLTD